MKNLKSNSSISISLVFLLSFLALGITIFSCGNKVNKAEILKEASTVDVAFAEKIIAANSSAGFADPEKGKKDSLVMMATFLRNYEYEEVVKIGNEYINRYGMDNDVKYMFATALFQQSEFGQAAKYYNDLLLEPDFSNSRMTKYYLALCYLSFDSPTDNKEMAVKLMKQLQQDPGDEFKVNELQVLIDLIN